MLHWQLLAAAAVALISGIANMLQWRAKLRWSTEHITATNRLLEAKDAERRELERQIDFWKEVASTKVIDQLLAARRQLEEYIARLEDDLSAKAALVRRLERETADTEQLQEEISHLQQNLAELKDVSVRLESIPGGAKNALFIPASLSYEEITAGLSEEEIADALEVGAILSKALDAASSTTARKPRPA